MSMTPPQFNIAKACFSLAALLLTLRVAAWFADVDSSRLERIFFGFLIFGGIGTMWLESVGWIRNLQPKRTNKNEIVTLEPLHVTFKTELIDMSRNLQTHVFGFSIAPGMGTQFRQSP